MWSGGPCTLPKVRGSCLQTKNIAFLKQHKGHTGLHSPLSPTAICPFVVSAKRCVSLSPAVCSHLFVCTQAIGFKDGLRP